MVFTKEEYNSRLIAVKRELYSSLVKTISGVYLNLLKLSIMNNGKNKLAIVPDKQF